MKIKIVIAIIAFIIFSTIIFLKVSATKNKLNLNYLSFCQELSQSSHNAQNWHFVIYLDIKACLTCNDHIQSWVELEQILPQFDGSMSIYTNQQDSIDVAIAMDLEGLNTKVRVLDNIWIKRFELFDKRTPIKILFDNNCEPILINGSFGNKKEAELFYVELVSKIRS